MVIVVRFCVHNIRVEYSTIRILTEVVGVIRHHCFSTNQTSIIPDPFASVLQSVGRNIVAVFWDLDSKPPRPVSPFDAAIRLEKAAQSFGAVRYKVAYGNQHSFDYVPLKIREHRRDRKALNQLVYKCVVKRLDTYICRVCGRKFYHNEKLINHFKQVHECEHKKRVSQIESAKGSQRVKLFGKYSMKMEKYNNAARDVLTPKVGYGLGDELKRAGYWDSVVSNKPQAAYVTLTKHMVDMMVRQQMDCLILVSDDSDFVEVLKEARLRRLKTVVVGDSKDGALKRVSDTAFSWQEIIMGKAEKEAVSVLGQWKDGDILKRLEWAYNYERERKLYGSCSEDTDDQYDELDGGNLISDELKMDQSRAWWKLDSESDASASFF